MCVCVFIVRGRGEADITIYKPHLQHYNCTSIRFGRVPCEPLCCVGVGDLKIESGNEFRNQRETLRQANDCCLFACCWVILIVLYRNACVVHIYENTHIAEWHPPKVFNFSLLRFNGNPTTTTTTVERKRRRNFVDFHNNVHGQLRTQTHTHTHDTAFTHVFSIIYTPQYVCIFVILFMNCVSQISVDTPRTLLYTQLPVYSTLYTLVESSRGDVISHICFLCRATMI